MRIADHGKFLALATALLGCGSSQVNPGQVIPPPNNSGYVDLNINLVISSGTSPSGGLCAHYTAQLEQPDATGTFVSVSNDTEMTTQTGPATSAVLACLAVSAAPSTANAVENITVTDFFDCQSKAPVSATAAEPQQSITFNCVEDEDIAVPATFTVSL